MTLTEVIQFAENGDLRAAVALGDYYMKKNTGEGIEEAVKWYERAAKKNVMYAMHMTVLGKKISAYAGMQIAGSGDFGYEFAMKDWKDTYEWAVKEVQCLNAKYPGYEKINYEDAVKNRNESAYYLALLYYFMDRYSEALKLLCDIEGKRETILKGLCINQLAKTVEEYERAFNCLKTLDGDLEYMSMQKPSLEEAAFSIAVLELSTSYRLGIGYRNANMNEAVRLLQVAQKNVKVTGSLELIEEELKHYKKKLLGGYRYVE